MIKYGTELVYKDKIIYYSTYNFKTGMHVCHYSKEGSFFPKTLVLKREQFKIRKSKENTEYIFEPALF